MNMTHDVAVVTGAVSGIGAALARRLHRRGARLVLADAGTHPSPVWEAPHREWERVMAVNLGAW